MNDRTTRIGLYFERWATSFALGLFLVLPLHFKSLGYNEIFFGQVYAVGILGTILTVAFSASWIRYLGFSKVVPMGSLLYTIGCLFYLVDRQCSLFGYYLASLLQGAGWGLSFTTGPIGIASTLEDKFHTDRTYYFTVYSAYTALGVGMAPLLVRLLTTSFGWTSQHIFILAALSSTLSWLVSLRVARHNQAYKSIQVSQLSSISELVEILKQPSVYFFAMVLFGACIYTTIINLQMTFAAYQGIDYTIFYTFYSLAVVLARFFLSKPLSNVPALKSITILMFAVMLGIACLFLADDLIVCYVMGSLLLGIGYGLVYPIVQAESVRYVSASIKSAVLIYFSLSYFIGVYLFPYLGTLIATYCSYDALLLVLVIAGGMELLTALYFYLVVYQKMKTVLSQSACGGD